MLLYWGLTFEVYIPVSVSVAVLGSDISGLHAGECECCCIGQ
jgi:hypothetical protein